MVIKKINAVLSLITVLFLALHAGYVSYAYLTMYYNPFLTNLFAGLIMIPASLHGILGMIIVFLSSEGTRADLYPKFNKLTVIQRVSAALIFPMLFIHVNTFIFFTKAAEAGKPGLFIPIIISEILIFGTVIIHAAVSFPKALITMGWLGSVKGEKRIRIISLAVGGVLFVIACFAVIRGQLIMFAGR